MRSSSLVMSAAVIQSCGTCSINRRIISGYLVLSLWRILTVAQFAVASAVPGRASTPPPHRRSRCRIDPAARGLVCSPHARHIGWLGGLEAGDFGCARSLPPVSIEFVVVVLLLSLAATTLTVTPSAAGASLIAALPYLVSPRPGALGGFECANLRSW